MHSIAHFILEKDPTKKVLYVTSETFTNELIDALKIGKNGNELAMTTFREKYRNNDVLLIDDIQFIIGKESTQEEFSIHSTIFMFPESRSSSPVINLQKISRLWRHVCVPGLNGD